jgi:uracil-DNA glycosylase family 4
MSNAKDFRSAIAAHLEFYGELGVSGVSRDPVWRARQATVPTSAPALAVAPEAAPTDTTSRVETVSEDAASEAATFGAAASDAAPAMQRSQGEAEQMPRSTEDVLVEIRQDIGDCTRCKLCKLGRTQIVFGVGSPRAQLMFVGEAPGQDEDIQGEPFVGRAGQLLTKIIEAIGLTRQEVYIANVIKCRPPQNRNPEPDEVASCEPFLFRQIDAIKPRVIVALGTFAAQCLLKTNDPISRMRGRIYKYRGAQLIPTFHPAFLLRSPERKRDVWEDMKKVRGLLQGGEDDE